MDLEKKDFTRFRFLKEQREIATVHLKNAVRPLKQRALYTRLTTIVNIIMKIILINTPHLTNYVLGYDVTDDSISS